MLLPVLQQQIQAHLPQQQHFLIGLSGGVDSVCLLHLFAHTEYQVRAIYIHHGLSQNADHWAQFCQQLCESLNIPFVMKKVQLATEQGIEAEARKARYRAIGEEILPQEVLVTAHHQDDQAETFLLALKRGSGVKGLGAMQAVGFSQKFTIFRPLLGVAKQAIQHYAQQHNLTWIEDESNQDNRFDRNFLRNEILPKLNQRWPQMDAMIARSAQLCAEQQQLLEELLSEELARYINMQQQSLDISHFPHFSVLKQQQLIRLWLDKCNILMPTQAQLAQILQQCVAASDKQPVIQLGTQTIRRYRTRLFITPKFAETQDFATTLTPSQCIQLPDHIGKVCHLGDTIICKFSDKTDLLQLPEPLWNQPLQLKLHHTGKLACYGKSMREDVKKIWQRAQIPVWERMRTPLIFHREELVGLLSKY